MTLAELKAADDTDYADESSYDGSIRVIRVIRDFKFLPLKIDHSSLVDSGTRAGLDHNPVFRNFSSSL